ncbi:hypothetical protein ES703_04480 [subsurface metagenome]
MKKLFLNFFNLIYKKIFAEEMTANVEIFFKNLGYVALGFGIAKVLTVIFNILAGRILGPEEYGKFTLVISIAMFLCIPMFCGITTAMVKYNAEEEDFQRRSTIISTAYLMVFLFSLVSIFFYLIFRPRLLRLFSISASIFYLILLFTIIYALSSIITRTLQGLHEMKKRSMLEIIFGVGLLGVFILFVFMKDSRTFIAALLAICIAYVLVIIIGIASIYKYFSFRFSRYWANKLIRYGFYSLLAAVSFIFLTNVDKVMINKYLATGDLGIYRAYHASSLGIVSSFMVMFTTVFFPAASKSKTKWKIFKRINRFIPYLIIFGLPILVGGEFIALKLYGESYPINPVLLILFALGAITISLYGAYAWLIISVGKTGAKIGMMALVIAASFNIILNRALIPLIGITGAILATIFSYLIAVSFLLPKAKILQVSKEDEEN